MLRKHKDRYTGLKSTAKTLSSGRRVSYYYDRATHQRIQGVPGTPEFDENYTRVTGRAPVGPAAVPPGPTPGTVAAVWAAFQTDDEYRALAPATQHDLCRHMRFWEQAVGDVPIADLCRRHITGVRKLFAETPRTAQHKVQTMRRLLSYALDQELVKQNVASRVKVRLFPRDEVWQADDVVLFFERAPLHVAVVALVGLLSGQREDDLLSLECSQLRPDGLTLKQSKTGVVVFLAWDQHPDLKAVLDLWLAVQPAPPQGHVFTGQHGKPWTGGGFRCAMNKAKKLCQSPRITNLTFHDLRRSCVVELALAGLTIRGISQVTGHEDSSVLEILKIYLPRSLLLEDHGERRPRRRVRIENGIAFRTEEQASLATLLATRLTQARESALTVSAPAAMDAGPHQEATLGLRAGGGPAPRVQPHA